MKKAKDILNLRILTWVILGVAAALSVAAIIVVLTHRAPRVAPNCSKSDSQIITVQVADGDTLSKLLTEQGLTYSDVDAIAKILKKDADITTLRAQSDKIEFIRDNEDAPATRFAIIPSPWRRVEVSRNTEGQWQCNTVDITDRKSVV